MCILQFKQGEGSLPWLDGTQRDRVHQFATHLETDQITSQVMLCFPMQGHTTCTLRVTHATFLLPLHSPLSHYLYETFKELEEVQNLCRKHFGDHPWPDAEQMTIL
jgi:hypothetical protein